MTREYCSGIIKLLFDGITDYNTHEHFTHYPHTTQLVKYPRVLSGKPLNKVSLFYFDRWHVCVVIALFHAAAMLSPRKTKAFVFARLNSFSSFSLRGWTGKMFCVYAKQPLRDKSLLAYFMAISFCPFL